MISLFAEAPALPLHTAGPYVAAAYIVFLLVILSYVGIMARRLTSNSRELRELRRQIEERELTGADPAGSAPVPDRAESPLEPAAHE
jgi:hypothetical protein